MTNNSDVYVVYIFALILFSFLAGFIVYFISLYQKRQIQNKRDQDNLQSSFKQEILKTQIEVQEQTLSNVGREIHDNITQVLSFVKLDLARIASSVPDAQQQKITESRDLIARAIADLRHLSKSLSFEHVMQQGLINALQAEAARTNNSGIIQINIKVEGESYSLGEQRELVLFRIFQETLNNALKHAGANRLNISLQYSEQLFNLTLEDDGVGFSPEAMVNNSGSGLKNMQNRAAMVGAVSTVYSSPGNGCSINIALNPNNKQLYADGPHPNSIS